MMFTPKSIQFCISPTKKKAGKECCAYSCHATPIAKKRGLCHKHYHIHRRILDPVYDRFVNFRGNALRRGKTFEITLAEFREWCDKEGYIVRKGYRGKNATVDRIDNTQGYHIGNIQLLKNMANIRKYHDHDKHITELPTDHEDWSPF